MALIFLRHTRPEVADGTCYGCTDLDVAESFDWDAEEVLSRLPRVGAVVTSPLRRCRLLADRIAGRRRLPLAVEPGFAEMDFGAWEGRPWDDIPLGERDLWKRDFMDARPHGGESVARLAARTAAAARAHLPEDGPPALVVTHMGPIRAALAWRDGPSGWEAPVDFGAWTEIRAEHVPAE